MPVEKVAIGPNGERALYRLATNDVTGDRKWVLVRPTDLHYAGLGSEHLDNVIHRLSDNPENVIEDRRTGVTKARAADAETMSIPDKIKFGIAETGSGFAEGIKELAYNTDGFISSLLGNDEAATESWRKAQGVINRRIRNRELLNEYSHSARPWAALGSAPYYLLSGVLAGPTARHISSAATTAVADTAKTVASETKNVFARNLRAAAESKIPPVKWFGEKAVKDHIVPIEQWVAERKLRPPMKSPYRAGTLDDILGGTLLGAVEGGLNADLDIADGAKASLMGSLSGRILKPYLENAKLPDDTAYSQSLQRVKAKGYVPLPGELLDDPSLQSREHAMRSHDKYSALLKNHDNANEVALNRLAYGLIGVKADRLPPAQLRAAITNLQNQYSNLEAQTVVKLDQPSLAALNAHVLGLTKTTTFEGTQAAKLAHEYLLKMKHLRGQQARGRDSATGRIKPSVTDSVNWQKLRSDLKEDIASFSAKGENDKVRALKPFVDALDNAVVRGLRATGKTAEEGEALVNKWRNLNEQYAMGKILMHHGMDAFGNVSPDRLSRYFTNHDAERYLMGALDENAPVNTLHDIARTAPIERRQMGSSLSGLNEVEVGKDSQKTQRQIFLGTPAALMPKALTEAYFRNYRAGRPQVTGLLNFDGKGLARTELYTRALAQASQIHPTIIDYTEDAVSKALHPARTLQETIDFILRRAKINENQ